MKNVIGEIFNYGKLFVKYQSVKRKYNSCKKKLENAIIQNEELNKNLEYEKNRTKTFRSCYRKKLREFENCMGGKKCTNAKRGDDQ